MKGDGDTERTEEKQSPCLSPSPSPLAGIRCEGWKVSEETLPSTTSEAQARESIFSLGNGVVGVRGFLEESEWNDRTHRSSSEAYSTLSSNNKNTGVACGGQEESGDGKPRLRGVYVAGFTEQCIQQEVGWLSCGSGTKDSLLVPVPDPFGINVFVGGELVSTTTGRVIRHARRLDLHTGELHRFLDWESSQHQRRVRIECTRMLSCVKKNIGAVRYTVWAQKTYNTDVRIVSYISLPTDSATARACTVETMADASDMNSSTNVVMTRTRNSCRRVAVATFEKCMWNNEGETLLSSSPFLQPTGAESQTEDSGGGGSVEEFCGLSLLQNRDRLSWTPMVPQTQQTDYGCEVMYSCCDNDNVCVDIVKFAGFFTEDDAPVDELCEFADSQIRSVAAKGYESLYDAHQQKMSQVWDTVDVKMKINPAISAAYRFNALQVLMASSPFPFYGFPSRGLSSASSSSGYHTWEVDAIVIPFLSHVYPQRARNLLEFRCRNLHHARIHAQDIELRRGAWYPYRTVNGNDSEVPFCVAYIFLNAVIAYAMRQYVTITNDFSILFKDGGAEVVMASALVYLEWGTWDRGAFHLRAVSGPDTTSGVVDNNFFTNLMVQQHLEWAVQIASVCRKNDPRFWEELMARNEMSEVDVEVMERAASHVVLVFDAQYRVHAMDQYFMKKKQWNPHNVGLIQDFKGNSLAHPQVSRYQLCSIPDVVLACMLLPEKFTTDEVHANFNFYEPITVSWESPLRLGIFSVISAQLRLPEKSSRYLHEALSANLSSIPYNEEGVDCATAASTWWSLAAGFCGMRVVQGTLHFSPTLPQECDGFQFTCRHNGCLIKVKVTRRAAQYLLVSSTSSIEELLIVHSGTTRLHLKCGVTEVVKLIGEIPSFNFDGVVFDINSLVSNIQDLLFKAWEKVLKKFFQEEKKKSDFNFTMEMFTTYLQSDQPIDGLKTICDLLNCSLEIAEEDQPYISTEIVLYGLCTQKNEIFRKLVEKHGLVFRNGAFELLTQLHQADIAVGCVAGSTFGRWLLKQYPNFAALLDSYVDGAVGSELSLSYFPSADYFHHCTKKISCSISRTILVVESASPFYAEHLDPFCAVVDLQRGSVTSETEVKEESPTLGRSTRSFSNRSISFHSLQELSLIVLDRVASRFN